MEEDWRRLSVPRKAWMVWNAENAEKVRSGNAWEM